MAENQAFKTFIIYARDDKAYKDQLLRHLRPLVSSGYLSVWHDGDILPGEDWERKIKANLKTSQLVLVLVSVNCLNSDFIEGEELETAVSQLNDGHTRIVPIIISPCGWRFHKLFVGLQGLPEDMKPVSNWADPHQAWTDVVESLAKIVEETRAEQAETAKKQRETEEQNRLALLDAEREAQQKTEQDERERIAQEEREREMAEQKRKAEAEKQALADLAARQAHAEQLRLEQEAERKRQRQAAITEGGGNKQILWAGLGVIALLAVVLLVIRPCKKREVTKQDPPPTELNNGQAADQSAFEQAKQRGTVPVWKDFVSRYPNSPKIQEAKTQLKGLEMLRDSLLKEAGDYIEVKRPLKAKEMIDKADDLDPNNPNLLTIKRSLQ